MDSDKYDSIVSESRKHDSFIVPGMMWNTFFKKLISLDGNEGNDYVDFADEMLIEHFEDEDSERPRSVSLNFEKKLKV